MIKSSHKKKLAINFLSLSSIQILSYLLPLLTLPYLTRVIGVERIGEIAIAAALVGSLNVLVDYGFSTTGIRGVALFKSNKEKLSEILTNILFIKIILSIAAFFILNILSLSFDKIREYYFLYTVSFGLIIGQAIFPMWFFQGIEKMSSIAYLNAVSKIIFTALVFLFVKNESEYILVPFFTSAVSIIIGFYSLIILKKSFGISIKKPEIKLIIFQLKEGWHIFISALFGNTYSQGNLLILAAFSSPEIVGLYSISQRISLSVVSLFQAISQTAYPHLVEVLSLSVENFVKHTKKFIKISSLASIVLFGSIWLCSPYIYEMIVPKASYLGLMSFRFWLIISFIISLNITLSPILFALKCDKKISQMYIILGLIYLIYAIPLTKIYLINGMLYSMLIVELSVFFWSIKLIRHQEKSIKGIVRC